METIPTSEIKRPKAIFHKIRILTYFNRLWVLTNQITFAHFNLGAGIYKRKIWQHKNILLYVLLGFAIGYFTKNQTTNANAFDISYISQDELIQLEHERIRNQDITDQQLFFGKLDEAIKLIEQIANEKAGSNNRVVFSQGIVSGNKVKSISHEVHKELISRYLYRD